VCFFWLVLHNRPLTWDNLRRRGWSGPGVCIFCHFADETLIHLLFQCDFAKEVWRIICSTLRVDWQDSIDNTEGIVRHWMRTQKSHRSLIIFICWGLWRCRNAFIFENIVPNIQIICNRIMGYYNLFSNCNLSTLVKHRMVEPLKDLQYPIGFFDGAAQGQLGGVGCRLWISPNHFYNLWMGLEDCTNNCSEIIALWLCLYWAMYLGITDIWIMGDSKVVIDWYNHVAELHSILLQHWCRSIRNL